MEEVLLLKFQQSPSMRSLLLNTGNAQLIYSDPTDTYWGDGVGLPQNSALGLDGHPGIPKGSNELGRALMRVRERLRNQEGQRGNVQATAPSVRM
jgi:ribA/ribD-fused uncharacterized protein